jgi:hypothetical protein
MPRTLRIGDDGDLDLTGGRAHWVTGPSAVAQNIRTRLRAFVGEWFLGLQRYGVRYWEDVLVHHPNGYALERAFADVILATPDVTGLDALDLDVPADGTRRLIVSGTARTATGPIDFRDVLEP